LPVQPNPGLRNANGLGAIERWSMKTGKPLLMPSTRLWQRSRHETLMSKYFSSRRHQFCHQPPRPDELQKRHIDFSSYPGARNRVIPQPLAQVPSRHGIPLQLAFTGLAIVPPVTGPW
jgi:hypothetical protein